ncbi:MAG: NAD(P)/FAD-dependent oxidoreductase [Flavobacteriales bacterium]|nr:NAD(P)/FAD-dependent oxidoreductase [Flavobacteriales bacterium]
MEIDIVKNEKERFVIIGGGFGGLEIARRLVKLNVQVVLIDRHNYHQFQPLFYQVATAGLEPSSIIFPFRRNFQRKDNFHFRMAEVDRIDGEKKIVHTSIGYLTFDKLIIATGATNNFFGNNEIEEHALAMKSINESLRIRNRVLEQFEEALSVPENEKKEHITFAIAGGGPTGVELAGSIAEMKRYILPKEYPELDFDQMRIILVEGAPRVLNAMLEKSSMKAKKYLEGLGVEVLVNTRVNGYDGTELTLNNDTTIRAKTLIWAAGIKGNYIDGIPEDAKVRGNRISVNQFNQIIGMEDVYAIGDVANMANVDLAYPNGHPQLAQVAIQQGNRFYKNMKDQLRGKEMTPFKYKNLGTMATVGRNKAVVELPKMKFYGFFAWLVWMLVHLRSILGVRNKFIVFLNWVWNYFTYNLSLRVIIKGGANKDQD